MNSTAQYLEAIEKYGPAPATPTEALAHTVAVYEDMPDAWMPVQATSGIYGDGVVTGLTMGDLRALHAALAAQPAVRRPSDATPRMTCDEHIAKGEQLLADADAIPAYNDEMNPVSTLLIAQATAHFLAAQAIPDEVVVDVSELTSLRGAVYQLRVIARHGDMSTTVRQELNDLLADLPA